MAINPNIALGIQQPQQVNMLGQYAQVMAIRAAQQEMEGNEGVRSALSRGVPEDPTQLLQYGKQGRATYESLLKGRKEQVDTAAKTLTMAGQIAGYVRDNPTPENFVNAVGTMVQNGVLTRAQAERVIADAGNDPAKIKSYAERTASDALSEADRLTARTRIQAANIGAAPGHRQADIAGRRLSMEEQQQADIARILRGEPSVGAGATTAPSMGGGAPVTGAMAPVSGGAPVTGAVAPVVGAPVIGAVTPVAAPATAPNVNALNAGATPATAANVNSLTAGAVPPEIAQMQTQIGQLIRVGTPKAIAAADALIKQHNMLMPSQQIVQNTKGEYVRVDQRSGASTPVLDASGQPLVGKLPPEQFESEYRKVVGKAAGDRDVGIATSATAAAGNLPKLYETLDQLKTSDAITGFGAGVIKNIEAFRAKFANDIKAGKRVADTEILDAMLGSDVFPMIQSLGVGAKGMDTPAEREFLRSVMTGTINMDKAALIKLTDIRKNIEERAIKRYNEAVDSGQLNRFFETQGVKPEKIEAPKYEPRLKQVDQDALNWAKTNPNDPRAAQILQRLGM
jgi:hypothetical protein